MESIDWSKEVFTLRGQEVSVEEGAWGAFKVISFVERVSGNPLTYPVDKCTGEPLVSGFDHYKVSNGKDEDFRHIELIALVRTIIESGTPWATDKVMGKALEEQMKHIGYKYIGDKE
jgi:hypothetical protein